MVPGVAGIAGVRYRTFLVWNAIGGVAWATLAVIGGWALGEVIATYVSNVSYVLLSVLLLAVLVHIFRSIRSKRTIRRRTGTVDSPLVESAAALDLVGPAEVRGADSMAAG